MSLLSLPCQYWPEVQPMLASAVWVSQSGYFQELVFQIWNFLCISLDCAFLLSCCFGTYPLDLGGRWAQLSWVLPPCPLQGPEAYPSQGHSGRMLSKVAQMPLSIALSPSSSWGYWCLPMPNNHSSMLWICPFGMGWPWLSQTMQERISLCSNWIQRWVKTTQGAVLVWGRAALGTGEMWNTI